MKYIKTYENNTKIIYRKNDFVKLKNDSDDEFAQPYAKIIRRNTYKDSYFDTYLVEILYPNTEHWSYSKYEDEHQATIEEYRIARKLSKKEMEEIKLKIASDKYNL